MYILLYLIYKFNSSYYLSVIYSNDYYILYHYIFCNFLSISLSQTDLLEKIAIYIKGIGTIKNFASLSVLH